MYKVIWDIETKGILLTDKADEKTELVPPRPVFWQELDFFGFNKYWNYEKVKEPLLWAIDRRYFYKGQMVAEARGGNIFECPKITITEVGQNLNLIPVNVPLMTKKNKKAILKSKPSKPAGTNSLILKDYRTNGGLTERSN